MATVTTNFNFPIPQSTDLVKDGATAIAALGTSVDTQFVDLKGGTTGQVLAKASNTDLDYSWTTPQIGDITAITASSPLTGGGTSGDVTVGILDATTSNKGAVQLSTSTTSTSTTLAATASAVKAAYDPAFTNNFYAGKNKVINGDFGIWQRGTSFSNPSPLSYTADRWQIEHDGSGATRTISRQTFTPGTAPVSGYEATYFYQYAVTGGTSNTYQQFQEKLEDVRTFAGQTITLSFWAKADASRTLTLLYRTDYGSGGSSANQFSVGSATLTTSWARYSVTYAVPSVSGLTIGANSYGQWIFRLAAATAQTIDIWGVQIEAGSTATPFQTASGTLQGELALCQRYYQRLTPAAAYTPYGGSGFSASTTNFIVTLPFASTMRTAPTALEQSGTAGHYNAYQGSSGLTCTGVPTFYLATTYSISVGFPVSGATTGQGGIGRSDNTTSGYLGWSAEL